MALGVDLFGYDAAGTLIWHRLCRFWEGGRLQDILGSRLEPSDLWPAWKCILTTEDAVSLDKQFDQPEWRRSTFPNDADVEDLLQRSGLDRIMLRIEEWGYG